MALYRPFRPSLAPSHASNPTFYEGASNGEISHVDEDDRRSPVSNPQDDPNRDHEHNNHVLNQQDENNNHNTNTNTNTNTNNSTNQQKGDNYATLPSSSTSSSASSIHPPPSSASSTTSSSVKPSPLDDQFIQAFPPPAQAPSPAATPSLISQLHDYEDFIRRTLRASLPPVSVPPGRWEHMAAPVLHRSSYGSLPSQAPSRSSHESRFQQRSGVRRASTDPNSGASINSDLSGLRYTIDNTRRPVVPSRAASWNGQHNGVYTSLYTSQNVYNPPRTSTLMKPQRLAGQRTLGVSNVPGEAFSKLPREILVVIFSELRKLHLDCGDGTETCATCWMRDLSSLSLTNRKVGAVAQFTLFEKIWLVGPDLQKRFKKSPSRLKLLKRALENNEALAGYVKELKVPDMPESAATKLDQEKYFEVVASLVTSCPNLERLLGLYPAYNHDFSRLTHALSTRTKLVEHVWDIHPTPHQRPVSIDSTHSLGDVALLPEQSASFLSHHYNWPNLATLVIHCQPGGLIDQQLLSRTFNYLPLPSLAHLSLSAIPKLPKDIFESLPPLQSLHLSNLPALTSKHLISLTRSVCASTLTSLSIIHSNVSSLPTLTRLVSSLTSLQKLTLIQDASPTLPIGTSIFLHPYLASPTLTHLTWDLLIPNPHDPVNDATTILSKAIKAAGFPRLRVLKSPTDHTGSLQALCRPMDRIPNLPPSYSATWKAAGPTATLIDLIDTRRKDSGISIADSSTTSHSTSTSNSLSTSTSLSTSASYLHPHLTRSLRAARHAAQARIDAARSRAGFVIVAEDWSEGEAARRVTARFEIAGFAGTAGSRIEYCLDSDLDGRGVGMGSSSAKDEVGVVVEDLLVGEGGRDGAAAGKKCLCDGKWNSWDERNERARKGWMHRERVKWRAVEVGRLFS